MRAAAIALLSLVVAIVGYTLSFASGEDRYVPPEVSEALALADLQLPVLAWNFPDPGILERDSTYYAFATNAGGRNIATARSSNLVAWEMLPDAMPELAPWVRPVRGQVWAPEAIAIGSEIRLY